MELQELEDAEQNLDEVRWVAGGLPVELLWLDLEIPGLEEAGRGGTEI